MTVFALISAVLFGFFHPVDLGSLPSAADCYAAEVGNGVLVATTPACSESHEKRREMLISATESLSERTGKEVILTDDLLSYLSLKRMAERGVSEYERRALASRLYEAKDSLYRSGAKVGVS